MCNYLIILVKVNNWDCGTVICKKSDVLNIYCMLIISIFSKKIARLRLSCDSYCTITENTQLNNYFMRLYYNQIYFTQTNLWEHLFPQTRLGYYDVTARLILLMICLVLFLLYTICCVIFVISYLLFLLFVYLLFFICFA